MYQTLGAAPTVHRSGLSLQCHGAGLKHRGELMRVHSLSAGYKVRVSVCNDEMLIKIFQRACFSSKSRLYIHTKVL